MYENTFSFFKNLVRPIFFTSRKAIFFFIPSTLFDINGNLGGVHFRCVATKLNKLQIIS